MKTLRAQQPALADVDVRKGPAVPARRRSAGIGGLRQRQRRHAGAGAGARAVGSRLPADGAAGADGRSAALGLLEGAGYRRGHRADADRAAGVRRSLNRPGTDHKDGDQLTLVIRVAANDLAAVVVANTAADQLRNVGIAATVSALDPVVLYGDALA